MGFRAFAERNLKIILAAPCILYLFALSIFPLVFSLWLSFSVWDTVSGEIRFVGLENLKDLYIDKRFWESLVHTFVFAAGAVVLELAVGIVLALIVSGGIRGNKIFRLLFTLPMMVTPVAAAYMWQMLYYADRGPINHLLGLLGFPMFHWRTDYFLAYVSLIVTDLWIWGPFMFLVMLAGISALPVEPYEAALVDGASRTQIFRHITVAQLKSVIVAAVLLRSIDAFKVFDIIYVVTGGGPGTSTEVGSLYVYTVGWTQFRVGYASLMAYVLLIVVLIFGMVFLRYMRKRE